MLSSASLRRSACSSRPDCAGRAGRREYARSCARCSVAHLRRGPSGAHSPRSRRSGGSSRRCLERADRLAAFLSAQSGAEVTIRHRRGSPKGTRGRCTTVTLEAARATSCGWSRAACSAHPSSEEFRVMAALHDVGFPVARVRWHEPDRRRARPALLRHGLRRGRPAATPGPSPARTSSRSCMAPRPGLADDGHRLRHRAVGAGRSDAAQVDRWEGVYRRSTSTGCPSSTRRQPGYRPRARRRPGRGRAR